MKETEHKTEPKFKVRNWYQCTKDFFGKGVTFNKNTAYYCAIEGCLQDEYGCHIAIVKDLYDNFKLWDITKDVKEGDVLIGIYGTFIFMGESNGGYCGVLSDNTFIRGTGNNDMTKGLHPATKEQRDALLKAMTDAGYTFDFENKELKKIEQPELTEFEDAVKDLMNTYRDAIGDCDATTEEVKKHAAYMLSLIPPKPTVGWRPAWSEEDEHRVKDTIYFLDTAKKHYASVIELDACIDWLKSLKDRVGCEANCTTKWKPSEEQMKALAEALSLAKNCGEERAFDLRTLHEQLEKL